MCTRAHSDWWELLTSIAGVEESSLHAHGTHVLETLINGKVDGVAMVRVGVGQREKVCRPHKEIPVECVETDSWGGGGGGVKEEEKEKEKEKEEGGGGGGGGWGRGRGRRGRERGKGREKLT